MSFTNLVLLGLVLWSWYAALRWKIAADEWEKIASDANKMADEAIRMAKEANEISERFSAAFNARLKSPPEAS